PSGRELGGRDFVSFQKIGGVRALLPLSPVHLRLVQEENGDAVLSWIRRGRIDADSWQGEEIPLGEASERYLVTIAEPGGTVLRAIETAEPRWTYEAALQAQDFPIRPSLIDVSVHQISIAAGKGLPRRQTFSLN